MASTASAACFLHSSKAPARPPLAAGCRAQKQEVADHAAAVSRRLVLPALAAAAAAGTIKVSPADAAYGEAANVFGKPKKNTDFSEYRGDGFKMLVPSKWNPSKEVEFPGQVMRYEDNFDSICNVSVVVLDCDKNSVADYGTPEEFLGKFDFLLGKQTFSGETDSEGGFDSSAVATANILEASATAAGGTQYYNISVLTRTADGDEGGKHQLVTAAVKDKKLYVCKAQAGDKRWFKGARKFVESTASSFSLA